MKKEKTKFTLLSRPTMVFTVVKRYKYLDTIPCVHGRYIDKVGAVFETYARVKDVRFQ